MNRYLSITDLHRMAKGDARVRSSATFWSPLKRALMLGALTLLGSDSGVRAQGSAPTITPVFEPLYESAPRHLGRARIVHEERPGTFFENLTATEDGTLFLTSFLDGRLLFQPALFPAIPGRLSRGGVKV